MQGLILKQMEKKIIVQLDIQEKYLENFIVASEKRNSNYKESKTFLFERAKLMGMLEVAKIIGIDVMQYTWIYNAV